MRPILAVAMLLLGISMAMSEPEYSTMPSSFFHLGGPTFASLVQTEAEVGTDRDTITAPLVGKPGDQASPASSSANKNDSNNVGQTAPTLDQLCGALMSSAQDNDLPVPFFANLIWQESGLRNDVVSSKGAKGIAQFMPETAQQRGLTNPLDPLQALPASARLLHDLRAQFGNLGFAAAAYNAGPNRVSEWLAHGGTLPRETRGYVLNITGRSVEDWQKAPPADADLHFVRALPCRALPAFAELEQSQASPSQPAQSATAQVAQPQPEKFASAQVARPQPERRKEPEPPVRAERKRERREAKERIREARERVRHSPRERHRQA